MSTPVTPADLRLHGAGDGSVLAYCGGCREPLPRQPRPLTLAALLSAWEEHVEDRPDHLETVPAASWPVTDLSAEPPL